MLSGGGHLRHAVYDRIRESASLRTRVTVIDAVRHADMPLYYSCADILVSGSHHEGSGYAVLEAMACGATPCVTDIAAFRKLADGCGALWRAGDPHACAVALTRAIAGTSPQQRDRVVAHFREQLSWPVIARQTCDVYDHLRASRRERV
jgi:glycosyltransferase involved in cell wall biosynthesis